ncbi:hypothetical protein vseg_003640 [Gypsophila vaccaria]
MVHTSLICTTVTKHPPAISVDAETMLPTNSRAATSKQLAWDAERQRLRRALEMKDEVIDSLTSKLGITKDAEARAVKRYERALEYSIEAGEKLDQFASKLTELEHCLVLKTEELRNIKADKDARIQELKRSRDVIMRDLSSRIHELNDRFLNHRDFDINRTKSHKKAVEQSMKKASSVSLKRARKILDERSTDKVSHKRVKTMKTQPILSTEERQQSLKVNIPHPVEEPIMRCKFTTKCRPRGLVELINHLNPKQMEAVRQIGFGGLLHVKVTHMPQRILPWLIDAFCDRSHMFRISATKEFLLSKDDVHDFFGLPRGHKKLHFVATGKSKLSSQRNLKRVWRRKFGIVGTKEAIPLSKVLAKLLNSKDSGVVFKRLFVLYTMSSFLAPTSNHALDLKLLRAVQDVGEIRQLDWCSYVFDNLVTAISDCRTGRSNVCGCTLFLMLSYFHRFDFHGEVQPFSLPLIQHWTDEKLSDRVNRESQTGCLGNAPLSQVLYPICVNGPPTNEGLL